MSIHFQNRLRYSRERHSQCFYKMVHFQLADVGTHSIVSKLALTIWKRPTTAGSRPTRKDFATCGSCACGATSCNEVQRYMKLPGFKFRGANRNLLAAAYIQASWRMVSLAPARTLSNSTQIALPEKAAFSIQRVLRGLRVYL